jgi:hypothetical protein
VFCAAEVHEGDLLKELPTSLRTKIVSHVLHDVFESSHLFMARSPRFAASFVGIPCRKWPGVEPCSGMPYVLPLGLPAALSEHSSCQDAVSASLQPAHAFCSSPVHRQEQ